MLSIIFWNLGLPAWQWSEAVLQQRGRWRSALARGVSKHVASKDECECLLANQKMTSMSLRKIGLFFFIDTCSTWPNRIFNVLGLFFSNWRELTQSTSPASAWCRVCCEKPSSTGSLSYKWRIDCFACNRFSILTLRFGVKPHIIPSHILCYSVLF